MGLTGVVCRPPPSPHSGHALHGNWLGSFRLTQDCRRSRLRPSHPRGCHARAGFARGPCSLRGVRLDLRSGELHKGRTRLKVPDQSVEILKALLEHPGGLVLREELRERLWPANTFVDFEHGLNAAVRRLRLALGDSADVPRYIETLPRRGYRFIGTIDGAVVSGAAVANHAGAAGPLILETVASSPVRGAWKWKRTAVVVASVGVAVILTAVLFRGAPTAD